MKRALTANNCQTKHLWIVICHPDIRKDLFMNTMSHLDELEAEAIYIMREVVAECEKPVILY